MAQLFLRINYVLFCDFFLFSYDLVVFFQSYHDRQLSCYNTLWQITHSSLQYILIDFSLTVKAAALIFMSGRGWAKFHLLNKGNQVLFISW